MTTNNRLYRSRLASLIFAALLSLSFSFTAQAQDRGEKVELHNRLSSLLEDVSVLERKLGNIPTTKKQRKKLNTSISKIRRKISRLMAATPSHVRRFNSSAPQVQRNGSSVTRQSQVVIQKATLVPTPGPQAVAAKPKPKLRKAIGKNAFASLLSTVEGESFASGKIQVLKSAAAHHHFRISQVSQLLNKFSFSGEKIKAVRILYPKVVDRKNAFKLYNAFTFETDKRKLRAILDN